MSAKAAELIRRACQGRKILPGPWTQDGSVCALQAVLECNGWFQGEPRIPKLCEILGVDAFWIHRFFMGFDRNHQIKIIHEDDKESIDEVSRLGIMIRKECVK